MLKKSLSFTLGALLLITMLFSLLTGCGGTNGNNNSSQVQSTKEQSSTSTQEKTQETAPAKKDVTLVIASSQNWIKDIDRTLAEDFTKETGIKTDIQVNPDDQYANIIKTKIATGEAPDVFLTSAGLDLMKYTPENTLLDLSNEAWAPRLKDWARNSASVNGKLYGLNLWSVDAWAILYNTDIFTKYSLSVPSNYQDFLKICDTLKSKGITPIYENSMDVWHTPLWLAAVISEAAVKDPAIYEKLNTNKIKFTEVKEFETALAQLSELKQKGFFGKNYMSDTWNNSYEAMGSGKFAMMLAYSSYQNEVASKYPQSGAEKWKMFPVPVADCKSLAISAGGVIRVVSKDSKNIEEVKKYFEFLTQADNVKKFYEGRQDLGETSFKDVEGKTTEAWKSVLDAAQGKMSLDMYAGVLYADQMKDGKLMQDMFVNNMTPKQVLESIDENRAKTAKTAGTQGW